MYITGEISGEYGLGKREDLVKFLGQIGMLEPYITFSKKICKKNLINILAYHRVNYPEKAAPFNPESIEATPKQFDRQIEFLKNYFKIVSFEQLTNILKNNEPINDPLAIITIDDGYKDAYTQAYPILKKHGVSATVFISTGPMLTVTLSAVLLAGCGMLRSYTAPRILSATTRASAIGASGSRTMNSSPP